MALRLDFAARSHVGLVRQGNEDSAYAGPHMLVVADGMGGHAAGEVASAAVVRVLADLEPELTAAGSDPVEGLREGITAAGHELRRISDASPDVEGMGTTVTVLLQVGDRVAVAQVGDSRAYLLRDGVLEQLTHDQTFVQTLVDEGRLRPDEAASHPQRSLLLQALDGRFDVEPEVGVRAPASGDRYLVCSDGLSGVLSEATLRDVLAEGTPEEAVGRLVDLALRAGAPDNVTGIVADVVSDDTEPGAPALLVGAVAPPAGAAVRSARGGAADVEDQPDGDEAEPAADSLEEPARRRIGLVLPLVLLVALVAAGGWLGYRWTQDQYYVGADEDQVVIFQGVSGTVAGRSLSRIVEPTDLEVADLPAITQQQVEATIAARDLADARTIVARLRDEAASCATATPLPAGCPPRPTPSPALTPSPTPTPAPTPAPAPPLTPEPSPSPVVAG